LEERAAGLGSLNFIVGCLLIVVAFTFVALVCVGGTFGAFSMFSS
jgi:hypothetical protein